MKAVDFFRVKVNGSMCAIFFFTAPTKSSKHCVTEKNTAARMMNYVHEATANVTILAKFRLSEGEFIKNRLIWEKNTLKL